LDAFSIPRILLSSARAHEEVVVGFSAVEQTGQPLREYDRKGMEMDIPRHRIHQILRFYTKQLKFTETNTPKKTISSNTFQDEFRLSFDGKKQQLIDHVIAEAIVQLTTHVWERKKRRIAEDVPHDIFPEDGRRKLYGTLSQDSSRG
jgi:hypothetical protein